MDIIFLSHFNAIKRKPVTIPGGLENFKTIYYKKKICHTWRKKINFLFLYSFLWGKKFLCMGRKLDFSLRYDLYNNSVLLFLFFSSVISVRQVETQMKAMDNEMSSFEKSILDR